MPVKVKRELLANNLASCLATSHANKQLALEAMEIYKAHIAVVSAGNRRLVQYLYAIREVNDQATVNYYVDKAIELAECLAGPYPESD